MADNGGRVLFEQHFKQRKGRQCGIDDTETPNKAVYDLDGFDTVRDRSGVWENNTWRPDSCEYSASDGLVRSRLRHHQFLVAGDSISSRFAQGLKHYASTQFMLIGWGADMNGFGLSYLFQPNRQ